MNKIYIPLHFFPNYGIISQEIENESVKNNMILDIITDSGNVENSINLRDSAFTDEGQWYITHPTTKERFYLQRSAFIIGQSRCTHVQSMWTLRIIRGKLDKLWCENFSYKKERSCHEYWKGIEEKTEAEFIQAIEYNHLLDKEEKGQILDITL